MEGRKVKVNVSQQRSEEERAGTGQRVAALRAERGLSLENLAREASSTLNTVWNIEQGNRDPSLRTLEGLAHALDVSTSYLISGE